MKMASRLSVAFALVLLCLAFVFVQSTPVKNNHDESSNLNRQKRSFWGFGSGWRYDLGIPYFGYTSLRFPYTRFGAMERNVTKIWSTLNATRDENKEINVKLAKLEKDLASIIEVFQRWCGFLDDGADKPKLCEQKSKNPATDPLPTNAPEIGPTQEPPSTAGPEEKFQPEQQVTPVEQEASTTGQTPSSVASSTAAVPIEATTIDDELPQNNEVFI